MRVDVRPRLVEKDRFGGRRECPSQRHTLLLSAGELMRVLITEPAEVDEREQHGDARGALPTRDPEGDVLRHREVGEEGVVLEDHSDATPLRRDPAARSCNVLAGDGDGPGVGRLETGDQAQKGRLATTGRAEKRDDLTSADAERGGRDGLHAPETPGHALEGDHRAIHVRRTLQAIGALFHRDRGRPEQHLGSIDAPRVRLPARLLARRRPRVHLRGPGRCRQGGDRSGAARSQHDAWRRRRDRRRGAGGIKLANVGKVLDRIPPTLVDLALWIADYYGTTPARALELVAPVRRAPRGERPSPAERESLPGEPSPAALTTEQSTAVERLVAGLGEGSGAHLLLVGPTGSGKTEVYLQACEAALGRGLGTIVLVPEIALAPQTVGRFRERFGDTVAILHSALGEAERRDERDRVARGEARVVVGARSAVFAPMRNLGLVIVDEEHDSSYKQESDPRYDARTVAAKRAALEGAVAVYGSATPRPESWATLERIVLSARIGAPMPRVRIVDLRRESGYPLSAPLLTELGRLAERGGKAILLLNRRGVTPGDPLSCLWTVEKVRELRRRPDAPRRRRAPLPSLRTS